MGDRRLMNVYLVQLALGMSAREFFGRASGRIGDCGGCLLFVGE